MKISTIHTPRLTLRAFEAKDAEPLLHILSEPDILQFFPKSDPPTIEGVNKFVVRQLDHWQKHGHGWWAVTERESGDLLGWNGLQYLPDTDEIEIGFLIKKSHWGQGLTTEAGLEGIRYGFETHKLDFIVGIVHPDNIASQRVLEKLGLIRDKRTEYFGMDVFRYEIKQGEYQGE